MRVYSLTDRGDLQTLLKVHKRMPDMRLGEVLLEEDLISHQQLDEALNDQLGATTGKRHLGQILIEHGVVTPEQLNIALAKKLAIPYIRLENFDVDVDVVTLIPSEVALKCRAVPLTIIDSVLIIAMANPLDQAALSELRFNCNVSIDAVMASSKDVQKALEKYYSQYEEEEALEDLKMDPVAEQYPIESLQNIEEEAQKKPIVRLLNAIVLQAVMRGASDINIRPEKDRVNVYYRVDGKMQYVRSLSRTILRPLVSRVKITGQMDIAERRLPQDGHARVTRGNRQIDLRLSVIPMVNGESVVIRVLDKDVGFRPLSQLGLREQEMQIINRLISRPHGMFLITGPTGAGKSTTLYAILNEVKKRSPHILTVEDPVEYDMEGVEQVQISIAKGYTFAQALRHFLRHDPDVIMVGEIRDEETAQIAGKAAMTGHLVFSTLHTNDAPSTITRLVDMGIAPYLLSSGLLGVMAQRLVRVNCTNCATEEEVDPHVRENLSLHPDEVFFRGAGCYKCHYTGYAGRSTVVELLNVTPEIAEMILDERSAREIAARARMQGMQSLRENALELARQGQTSIEEVYALAAD